MAIIKPIHVIYAIILVDLQSSAALLLVLPVVLRTFWSAGAPHTGQNLESSGILAPHFLQNI